MKYLKLFKTEKDRIDFETGGGGVITPSVHFTRETRGVNYHPVQFIEDNTHNGYEYVDLGLPSGTLWAKCNVGSNSEYEAGDYFAWGEVEPKTSYTWNTYKWGSTQDSMTKYNLSDNKTVLDLEDDAAFVNMGGSWRMPTYDDYKELEENTTHLWISDGDYKLKELTSKINGSKLYIPSGGLHIGTNLMIKQSGFQWSSSLFYLDNSKSPSFIYSTSGFPDFFVMEYQTVDYNTVSLWGRHAGYNIRGVIKPNK